MKKTILFIFSLYLIVFFPIRTHSAEILQINNSSSILVGDQNRDLSIKLSCVEINDEDDEEIVWQKLQQKQYKCLT